MSAWFLTGNPLDFLCSLIYKYGVFSSSSFELSQAFFFSISGVLQFEYDMLTWLHPILHLPFSELPGFMVWCLSLILGISQLLLIQIFLLLHSLSLCLLLYSNYLHFKQYFPLVVGYSVFGFFFYPFSFLFLFHIDKFPLIYFHIY